MSFRQCVPANNDEDVAGAEFKLTCSSGGSSAASAERCRIASALQRCLAPVPNERMTSQPESALYPGQENTMEIAFAVALPAFIVGVFYLALWLQWQPG